MPNIDISRDATDQRKHYDRVHMQQGRVLTDDDFNEAERLDAEDARRVRVDVIGPAGSPDDGFRLKTVAGQLVLSAGTFYVGGLRLEMENPEPFNLPKDWLQQGSHPGEALTPPPGEQFDFVWLDVWQQPVSAVEDKELVEAALGGADTSARIRTMRRARVLRNVGNVDCAAAWTQLLSSLAPEGTVNGDFELVPDATLTVGPDGTAGTDDLCSPPVSGGYLGAENQAIRVQIVGANLFTWGFDNGAPLYRVKLLPDSTGASRRIHMLTVPKDQAHYPLEGQVVELLPWSALLSNGQKNAELSGYLAKVSGSYNPDTQDLLINAAPGNDTGTPAMPFGQRWSARSDAAVISNEDPPEDQYFYMCVWNRGGDTTSPAAINFVPGTPVSLAKTGIQVTFAGTNLRTNDFWIIAARPETPNVFIPWKLSSGRPPHGVRRWIAPLGLIHWPGGGGAPAVEDDCRPTFQPLTRLKGCCTYTVGDGTHSFGNFSKIQDAVTALPPEGGEICILPGDYPERIVLEQRHNITLRGCGRRTRLLEQDGQTDPVIQIRDCQDIAVHGLSVVATAVSGIELQGEAKLPLERIVLAELEISARDRSAILGRGGRFISLLSNLVSVAPLAGILGDDPTAGRQAAIFLAGDDLLIENNRIVGEIQEARARTPFGGLHIGGGSNRVEVRRNVIEGGNGNGITLGSFRFVPAQDAAIFTRFTGLTASPLHGLTISVDANGCIHIHPNPPPPTGDDGQPLVPVADEALSDVRIVDNDISGMGASGISVARFFDLTTHPDFITVDRLTIEGNRIRKCMLLELGEIPAALREYAGYGGIALADGEYLIIRNNTIEQNGGDHLDPICGVFVLFGEGIAIDGNRILHNGRPADPELTPLPGQRGGIVIGMAQPRKVSVAPFGTGFSGSRQDGVPAARVHGNIVVSPEGRALKMFAIGPVTVEANQLTAHGSNSLHRVPLPGASPGVTGGFAVTTAAAVPYANRSVTTNPLAAFLDALGGAVVSIVNLGVSNEIYLQLFGLSGLGLVDRFPGPGRQGDDVRLFVGGNILFNDNQVVLDAFGPVVTLSLSSVLLFSLDDISMTGNQCDCDLVLDLVGTNALVVGWSLRVADNRFKEGILNARLSAFTVGLMNSTIDNQGTHCFVAVGAPALSVVTPNRTLALLFNKDACGPYGLAVAGVAQRVGIALSAG